MEVDIHIDKLTDCLVKRQTGEIVETEYRKRNTSIKPIEYMGWKFDWSKTEKEGYTIYELFRKNSSIVEGRISFTLEGGVANVDIVETAPHNFGHKGKYEGVGGHLFAIACKISLDAGYDGFVAFTAKSDLVNHYQQTLGARCIDNQRMYIDDIAAKSLMEKYLEG